MNPHVTAGARSSHKPDAGPGPLGAARGLTARLSLEPASAAAVVLQSILEEANLLKNTVETDYSRCSP